MYGLKCISKVKRSSAWWYINSCSALYCFLFLHLSFLAKNIRLCCTWITFHHFTPELTQKLSCVFTQLELCDPETQGAKETRKFCLRENKQTCRQNLKQWSVSCHGQQQKKETSSSKYVLLKRLQSNDSFGADFLQREKWREVEIRGGEQKSN